MKYAAPFAEPFTFLSIRFALVVVVLAPFIMSSRYWRISAADAVAAGLVGALLHGVYLGGIFWAIKEGMPAGVAAITISLQPLMSASIVAPILGEKVEPRHWAGLLLGLFGAFVVLFPDGRVEQGGLTTAMLAMGVVSLAAITVGTTLQKAWFSHLDVRSALLPQYAGATLTMAVGAMLFET
ncbi:MAG: DMT family transporter, partial [Alphaproteobacteria bacterium]|nr:DMT family transporter [Alphaproteobacteria bacterium]